uniref:Uncharacterized protein n=1 Tax=Rhizophora mucronata TaxID=61149 RepID=A0A2P2NLU9_RHIMU
MYCRCYNMYVNQKPNDQKVYVTDQDPKIYKHFITIMKFRKIMPSNRLRTTAPQCFFSFN